MNKKLNPKLNNSFNIYFFQFHPAILGELGDCWLLAAMASLAMRRDLLDQVILPNQDFESEYDGKFHFRFWVFYIAQNNQFEQKIFKKIIFYKFSPRRVDVKQY